MNVVISNELLRLCPNYNVAVIVADITNTVYNAKLWEEIELISQNYRNKYNTESIKIIPAIYETREAYKRCGKEPSRYRPAAEALCRRIVKGDSLYKVNTVVDLINAVSIATGFSIGGFDADKIVGDTITYGIGRANEPYEGIGRGVLNIEGLPVWRDLVGGFGTPTSDNERTKLSLNTSHLLVTINSYGAQSESELKKAADYMLELLRKYANASNVYSAIY